MKYTKFDLIYSFASSIIYRIYLTLKAVINIFHTEFPKDFHLATKYGPIER